MCSRSDLRVLTLEWFKRKSVVVNEKSRTGLRYQFLGAAGMAGIFAALIALATPLVLPWADRSGQAITCGTGLHPALAVAAHEDTFNQLQHETLGSPFESSDYAAQCHTLITTRRSIAIAVGMLGALITLGALAVSHSHSRERPYPRVKRPRPRGQPRTFPAPGSPQRRRPSVHATARMGSGVQLGQMHPGASERRTR